MVRGLQVAKNVANLSGHRYEENHVDVPLESVDHQKDVDQDDDDHYPDDDLGLLVHMADRGNLERGQLEDEADDDEQQPSSQDLHSLLLDVVEGLLPILLVLLGVGRIRVAVALRDFVILELVEGHMALLRLDGVDGVVLFEVAFSLGLRIAFILSVLAFVIEL